MIWINDELGIGVSEISCAYSRSPGPGGQNVNKVATRVTLRWDVAHSPALTEPQRARIVEQLATRISRAGILRVVASRHRSQAANRRAAIERFSDLLADALRIQRPRRRTSPTRAAKERRLSEKRRRSRLKIERSQRYSGDST
ncbi:MAG: alternative ribosome rescue aminoacyl-tRNA hydrolase ArfB [Phycisphaerae bacterium]